MLISVGILFAPAIRFRLHGIFHEKNMPGKFSGEYAVLQTPDGIFLTTPQQSIPVRLPLEFTPEREETARIELTDVTLSLIHI